MSFTAPHISWPFQRDPVSGKIQTVEQGTPEHVNSQEWAVAVCPLGARQCRPDFGWPMPYMAGAPVDPQPLVDALNRLVPGPVRKASEYQTLAEDVSNRTIEVDANVGGQ